MSKQYTFLSKAILPLESFYICRAGLLFSQYSICVKWFQGTTFQTLQKDFSLPQWPGSPKLADFRRGSPPHLPWSMGAVEQKFISLQSLTGEQGSCWAISVNRCILPSIIFCQIGIYHLKPVFKEFFQASSCKKKVWSWILIFLNLLICRCAFFYKMNFSFSPLHTAYSLVKFIPFINC